MNNMQKAPEGLLQNPPIAIDLNAVALQRIREAYAVAFGPLPDGEYGKDADQHIIEIIRNAGRAGKHVDDVALDEFTEAMRTRMAQKRAQGFEGWEDPARCPINELINRAENCAIGKPVDRGIYSMMLYNRFKRS